MWQKNVQNRITNVRERKAVLKLEVHKKEHNFKVCSKACIGPVWSHIQPHGGCCYSFGSWEMVQETAVVTPSVWILCSESEILSVIEGIYLLTCFLLNYTLSLHSPILIRLFFFYSSLTLPGGGGVLFLFLHLCFLFNFSG